MIGVDSAGVDHQGELAVGEVDGGLARPGCQGLHSASERFDREHARPRVPATQSANRKRGDEQARSARAGELDEPQCEDLGSEASSVSPCIENVELRGAGPHMDTAEGPIRKGVGLERVAPRPDVWEESLAPGRGI
jgi:hypothetical protein